jgi:epsilon-lactone hydrolase
MLAGVARPPAARPLREVDLAGITALHLRDGASAAPSAERDAILLCHGGNFVSGGSRTHGAFAAWVARVTGADVYLPAYRVAPEHPHPAATDDLFTAYRAVLDLGHEPGRCAVMGDSAGAALAVAFVRTLPEMNVPSPGALVLLSPFLDLTLSSVSVGANARRDPMLRRSWLELGGLAYAGGLPRSDPRISPLYADLRTLPPTLIQVGTDEVLLDDATRFADRAYAAGVDVELQTFSGWWHDFQVFAGSLHGAREALEDVAAFMRRRFG